MRLKALKLAGFKSFVDPTTILFPSSLVGVIGPNGCGKSNVIDAVRWVMGESSAKQLRGDSMADVIFNGSSSRKPVGQASVELLFDNSAGMLQGEFAKYNEISVKRKATREGQSIYYLNGTRCRRRDVMDLFLGTGLGPRSYAIIEQGMISQLIEARPEELRILIEEAAGISKYKERRKETERRISQTRENLERLSDLRDELDKQLKRLERQSRTAEKYRTYKEEERELQAQLLALRWQDYDESVQAQDQLIRESETALEKEVATQRKLEAEIETVRVAHTEINDQFQQVQGDFYAVGAEIAKVEQSLKSQQEQVTRIQKERAQLEANLQSAKQNLRHAEETILSLEQFLAEQEPAQTAKQSEAEQASQAWEIAEEAWQQWQTAWQEFSENSVAPQRDVEVEKSKILQLERTQQDLTRRQQQIEEEQKQAPELDQQQVAQFEATIATQTEKIEQLREQSRKLQSDVYKQCEENRQQSRKLNDQEGNLQNVRGQLSALETLQKSALGGENSEKSLKKWVKQHNLETVLRLATQLQVESGWENAVEIALGSQLQAWCVGVDQEQSLLRSAAELKSGTVGFVSNAETTPSLRDTPPQEGNGSIASENSFENLISLSQKINLQDSQRNQQSDPATQNKTSDAPDVTHTTDASNAITELLHNIFAAENLDQALQLRDQLPAGGLFLTQNGIWVGRNWSRIAQSGEKSAESGLLQRETQIRELQQQQQTLEKTVTDIREQLKTGRETEQQNEAAHRDTDRELGQAQRMLSDAKNERDKQQALQDQAKARHKRLRQEQTEMKQREAEVVEELQQARGRLEVAIEAMAGLEAQRQQLGIEKLVKREAMENARRAAREAQEEAHKLTLQVESARTKLESGRKNREQLEQQKTQNGERNEVLAQEEQTAGRESVKLQEALETQLSQQQEVEAELTQHRQQLETHETRLRELESQRAKTEQMVTEQRTAHEKAMFEGQEARIRQRTIAEQIQQEGHSRLELIRNLPEAATVSTWEQNLEQLAEKIQKLGAVNLAAIEEFETEAERKQHLDQQNDDLVAALETLETAIQKIDRETRTRFRATFDEINEKLQRNFPALFGGGEADLKMVGENVLDAGVTIMARPPGKKNSTIHLLSGGEKALTAVALVFSIFELNPAPFCMLDEVDAPLDEANVGRFSERVKAMSSQVQFIFITHNKTTMEIADQLTGITMQEPGVSRMVAVDMEAAQGFSEID